MLLKTLIGVSRLQFLSLTFLTIAFAVASSWRVPNHKIQNYLLLVSLVAVLAHLLVNVLNEYRDFRSGLDLQTKRTAFSGGSGSLPKQPLKAPAVFYFVILLAFVLITLGGYLVVKLGAMSLIFGGLGLTFILFYTDQINRSPLVCYLAPGLGFGFCMYLGAQWVFTQGFSPEAILIALVLMVFISNLLLLNQFPDIKADQAVGRRTLPIVYGTKAAVFWLVGQYIFIYALLVIALLKGLLPAPTALVFLALPLFLYFVVLLTHQHSKPVYYPRLLKTHVIFIHLSLLLFLLGFFLSV